MKQRVRYIIGEKGYASLYKLIARLNPYWKTYREGVKAKERKFFYALFIKAGDLCFDIGANDGNRVEAFLASGAKVVAVEPQHACCKLLEKKFGSKIIIINKGAGSAPGKKRLYQSNISALSTFSEEWIKTVKDQRFENARWKESVAVEIITLDMLIREFGKPHYIKIDVEGFETEVLDGLSEAVSVISFEYTVPERTTNTVACINKIISLNEAVECNYTIGERMQFVLENWVSPAEMIALIISKEFTDSSAGDIYIRSK